MSEQIPIFDERYVSRGPESRTERVKLAPASEVVAGGDVVENFDEAVKRYGTNKPRRVVTRVRKQES